MNDIFTASVNKDLVWEMTHFHFHDHYEILLVTGGTCSFLMETEMIQASRGSVLLMKGGLLHMSTSLPDAAYTRYVINFVPSDLKEYGSAQTNLLAAFDCPPYYLQLTEEELAEMEPLFTSCCGHDDSFGADLRRNLHFLEILIRLGEMMHQDRNSLPMPDTENHRNYLRVKPIISYIFDNPTDSLSLDSVAEKFFYNKHYLCRIFKTATGISVGKYITSVHIQNAAQYLRRGYSVQESGELAGFKNNSNFISTFRKVMSCSPGQYRQRFRQNFE